MNLNPFILTNLTTDEMSAMSSLPVLKRVKRSLLQDEDRPTFSTLSVLKKIKNSSSIDDDESRKISTASALPLSKRVKISDPQDNDNLFTANESRKISTMTGLPVLKRVENSNLQKEENHSPMRMKADYDDVKYATEHNMKPVTSGANLSDNIPRKIFSDNKMVHENNTFFAGSRVLVKNDTAEYSQTTEFPYTESQYNYFKENPQILIDKNLKEGNITDGHILQEYILTGHKKATQQIYDTRNSKTFEIEQMEEESNVNKTVSVTSQSKTKIDNTEKDTKSYEMLKETRFTKQIPSINRLKTIKYKNADQQQIFNETKFAQQLDNSSLTITVLDSPRGVIVNVDEKEVGTTA